MHAFYISESQTPRHAKKMQKSCPNKNTTVPKKIKIKKNKPQTVYNTRRALASVTYEEGDTVTESSEGSPPPSDTES